MPANKVKSICIVGGGSAGWMTAAYVLEALPWATVTLVESPNIPTVGVGEATLLSFDKFLDDCNIDRYLWQNASDAAAKTGILFAKWKNNKTDIWHPFFFDGMWFPKGDDREYFARSAMGVQANLETDEYVEFASTWYIPSVEKKQLPDLRLHEIGYHVDAIKLAKFLSNHLITKHPTRLTHKPATVSNIVVKDGMIISIDTDSETITADLFIDCTGFKRLLSSSIPGSEFVVHDKMLFANAAVAGPVKYATENEIIPPYTICEACDYGWIWKTSIAGRIGSGLVYNDTLLSKEQAEEYFVNHWGKDRMLTEKFNHIKFKPENNLRNWRGNCFSVGLSSGFLEPLESTGLAIIIRSIKVGIDLIRKRYFVDEDIAYYNAEMNNLYTDAVDFVALHYMNSTNTGPFWDKVRAEFVPSQSLQTVIDIYSEQFVQEDSFQFNRIFHPDSWRIWLHATDHHMLVTPNDAAMTGLAEMGRTDLTKRGITNNEFIFLYKNFKEEHEQSMGHTDRDTAPTGREL
jgi:tryptophan halogenase